MKDIVSSLIGPLGAVLTLIAISYLEVGDLAAYWHVITALVLVLPAIFVALLALFVKLPITRTFVAVSSSAAPPPEALQLRIDGSLHRLKSIGFEPITPWVAHANKTFYLGNVFTILLQHPATSDLAILQMSEGVSELEFCRRRSDGSWLESAAVPGAIALSPGPPGDCLYVRAGTDSARLYKAHQARTARDARVVPNPRVGDPVAFLNEYEAREIEALIAAGHMIRTRDNRTRASIKAAAVMGLRAASPWALLNLWRSQRQLRALTNR